VLTLVLACNPAHSQLTPVPTSDLPDSPGTVQQQQQSVVVVAEASFAANGTALPPCPTSAWKLLPVTNSPAEDQSRKTCIDVLNPYARFLDTRMAIPMTSRQKGYLAFHDLTDPFNLATILAISGFTVATDSHSAYGPGWKGFGKSSGISFVQDATGEFFGTWLIPTITHQDPHYRRLPNSTIPRRFLHAISRTVIAQNDNGATMPNYSTLLTYPIASEIGNLYVPGVETDSRSTTARILIGYATDPIDNLITEFLPDVARRVHIRVIFVQRILNQVATGQPGSN
jgi:hypothetical protein